MMSGAHSAPAGDLLSLHQARPCCDVALEPRDSLLAPQSHRLHAGHVLPLLQVDPAARKKNRLDDLVYVRETLRDIKSQEHELL